MQNIRSIAGIARILACTAVAACLIGEVVQACSIKVQAQQTWDPNGGNYTCLGVPSCQESSSSACTKTSTTVAKICSNPSGGQTTKCYTDVEQGPGCGSVPRPEGGGVPEQQTYHVSCPSGD